MERDPAMLVTEEEPRVEHDEDGSRCTQGGTIAPIVRVFPLGTYGVPISAARSGAPSSCCFVQPSVQQMTTSADLVWHRIAARAVCRHGGGWLGANFFYRCFMIANFGRARRSEGHSLRTNEMLDGVWNFRRSV
nr:hypothetical protein CFP56_52544 [Quercus suber]